MRTRARPRAVRRNVCAKACVRAHARACACARRRVGVDCTRGRACLACADQRAVDHCGAHRRLSDAVSGVLANLVSAQRGCRREAFMPCGRFESPAAGENTSLRRSGVPEHAMGDECGVVRQSRKSVCGTETSVARAKRQGV
eukprot:1031952-Pleurochrysis_carterae.AAC.1